MIVTKLCRTCLACPSQWEGLTEYGSVYIRFRHGRLTVGVGKTIDDAVAADPSFQMSMGDGGYMTDDQLRHYLRGSIELPKEIK